MGEQNRTAEVLGERSGRLERWIKDFEINYLIFAQMGARLLYCFLKLSICMAGIEHIEISEIGLPLPKKVNVLIKSASKMNIQAEWMRPVNLSEQQPFVAELIFKLRGRLEAYNRHIRTRFTTRYSDRAGSQSQQDCDHVLAG